MEVGDKVTTDTGVILEAKLQEGLHPCKGCSFYIHYWCGVLDMARSKRPTCWDEKGRGLIFVKSEDNE